MDPSLRNWAMVEAIYDTYTEDIYIQSSRVIQTFPKKASFKGHKADWNTKESQTLTAEFMTIPNIYDLAIAEAPIGSQGFDAALGVGTVTTLLGLCEVRGFNMVYVTPGEVKNALAKDPKATKETMVKLAKEKHPEIVWKRRNGKIVMKNAEHIADAVHAIYAAKQLGKLTI